MSLPYPDLCVDWGRKRGGGGARRPWVVEIYPGLLTMRYRDLFADHKRSAYDHFDMTVAMLNKTMGLCLRLDSRPKPRLSSKWSDRSR